MPTPIPLLTPSSTHTSPTHLADRLQADRQDLETLLLEHGALRFRGYALHTPADVEQVALAFDPQLAAGEYLGTSPRDALTRHVHSASELPGFYPIPQHTEMSFLQHPPRRIYFSCLLPSQLHGETPLCDFRLVWRDMQPDVKERLTTQGIRIVRNYAGPQTPRSLDPFALKRWDAMFGTTDHGKIAEICLREGMTAEWLDRDRLRLVCQPPVMRPHPQSQEPVYFSHLQVFHVGTPEAELRRIHQLRPGLRTAGWHQVGKLVANLTRQFKRPEDRAMDVTHADGTALADADVEHVRDVIWQHLVVEPWQRGDFVVVDNRSTSHGRLPYRGPRQVVVAWS